jgi:hypothetical protein
MCEWQMAWADGVGRCLGLSGVSWFCWYCFCSCDRSDEMLTIIDGNA